MVINIRGTGGSGKSHLVRAVMARYGTKLPAYEPRRKQPISYLLRHPEYADLRVLGHYETPCGGCDTIVSPAKVYELAVASTQINENVLMEGIIIGDDVVRCVALSKFTPVKVIALKTPIEECLAGIQSRRDERGDVRPLDPKNTVSRADRLKRNMSRLRDSGVDAVWLTREDALTTVLATLGISE